MREAALSRGVLEALVHEAVWKELPQAVHAQARLAMKRLQATGPTPRVRRLEASAYPRSYRLRVGHFRICFIHLPDEAVLVFTTAFLKRRPADYIRAAKRHDERVRAFE